MIRLILTLASSLLYLVTFGQVSNNDLSTINTIAQAEQFIAKNPKAKAKLFTISSIRDTSEMMLPLYSKKTGFTFNIENSNFKILQIDSNLTFRVKYIFFSGMEFTKKEIDIKRQGILSQYKKGTRFSSLVQKHTSDKNETGDTGWFAENTLVKGFEDAIKSHKKNDIFTVDIPEQNWYYVVLKTFDDKFAKKITLIKI
ncbi:MAG: hypothetical protein RIR11_3787 [Bacteroidota bacterium]|jgi:hypothetical protein